MTNKVIIFMGVGLVISICYMFGFGNFYLLYVWLW